MTTPHDELRLLPWSGPDGKPCFLSADDNAGYLSRLADNTEAMQLGLVSELLDHAFEGRCHGPQHRPRRADLSARQCGSGTG
ncbi:hypothetical protein ACWFQ8_21015 [Streptomyces sp. NPDC055254]